MCLVLHHGERRWAVTLQQEATRLGYVFAPPPPPPQPTAQYTHTTTKTQVHTCFHPVTLKALNERSSYTHTVVWKRLTHRADDGKAVSWWMVWVQWSVCLAGNNGCQIQFITTILDICLRHSLCSMQIIISYHFFKYIYCSDSCLEPSWSKYDF